MSDEKKTGAALVEKGEIVLELETKEEPLVELVIEEPVVELTPQEIAIKRYQDALENRGDTIKALLKARANVVKEQGALDKTYAVALKNSEFTDAEVKVLMTAKRRQLKEKLEEAEGKLRRTLRKI